MPRPVSPTLTEAELRLMRVVWERGSVTTGEVAGALAAEGIRLAESTVRTILGILRDKGYLRVEARGRAHAYSPLVTREQARRDALRYVLARFFDNSREELVLSLLRDEEVTAKELGRLRRMVQDYA